MTSINEIMQICRLCLVKEQVNVAIFGEQGDLQELVQKITACLPVKVAKEDQLPKKICDGCSYKLDLLYQFRNTSVSAEKQLLSWISQFDNAGGKSGGKEVGDLDKSQIIPHHTATVKEEVLEISEGGEGNPSGYSMVSHLNYEGSDGLYTESQDGNDAGADDLDYSSDDEPLAKRRKRILESQAKDDSLSHSKTEDIEHLQVTKIEDASGCSDDDENVDDPEPNFVSVGTDDGQEAGPSGIGKTTTEIPSEHSDDDNPLGTHYECELCLCVFPSKEAFINHHIRENAEGLVCCTCDESFSSSADLFQHQQSHRNNKRTISSTEIDFQQDTEDIQAVLNIPNEEIVIDSAANDLLYILDDSQCVNEIVIEETGVEVQKINNSFNKTSSDNGSVIYEDHGYLSRQISSNTTLDVKKKRNYISTKTRQPTPKRRHEVPDFSSSDYAVITPNSDIDIVHYKCLRCEQLFISKLAFFRHIEKGKCFVNNCDVCPAVFEKNSEFYDHYLLTHTDRAICNFCFRTFMYEKNVKEHMLRHLDQFRHRCDVCKKGFYTIREYRNHYKTRHMGIRHRCTDCNRSFADEYYFKRHVATHAKKTQCDGDVSL